MPQILKKKLRYISIVLCILSIVGCNKVNYPQSPVNIPGKTSTSKQDERNTPSTSTKIPFSELVKCKVERVIDGDTFEILSNGEKIKIRLIGVNTPESVASQEYLEETGQKNTQEGKEASEFTKRLLTDKTVYLEFDAAKEDKYGRLLAYVYLEDGQMVQDILLKNGYAELMTIQPNVKYADHFVETVQAARE